MNRTILTVAGVLSASSLLLVDSAVKGTVLLALAAVVALILRRDSAATRHLVWLLAIVAMLVVPVLSAMLPQWRVLPAWMSSSRPADVAVSPPSLVSPASGVIESPQMAAPAEVERLSASAFQPAAVQSDSQPVPATRATASAPTVWSWSWNNALPLAWAIGFSVLMLRLSAARWMLWNSERLATVIRRRVAPQLAAESRSDSATAQDTIVVTMDAICSQLGIGRPVTLLIHPHKTIPVVWGILRCRLMLPAAARQWSDEQLRSVLLHELAHIKRRDTIVQLLAQVACALHWFNPLVWFAAWRLDVERERSCDDLVLASGIRPSAYAGHLLDVVTGLSPARWTQACGLAMARKSSLEGRLTAVLGKDLNRRSVSVALAGLALAIAVGIAVPIAMLRAADEKREDSIPNSKTTIKLPPETVAKLKWGEPVKGLRMALAYPPALGDALLGKKPHFELVVQNVSEKEIHFLASDEAPNPRTMLIREGERIVTGLSDPEVSAADWKLPPGQCGVLRLYTKEEPDKAGTTPSSAIESDLSKIGRYHAIVQMEIAKAPAGAWTGKLVTGPTRGSADVAAAPTPMHKNARSLYEVWQRYARANGDIPGGLIGELAGSVKLFIKLNPTWETVPKLKEFIPRLDATHDWKPADAIALLDELATVKDSPLLMAVWKGTKHTIRKGEALSKKFAEVPWGKTQPNGLRAAWVLEPSGVEHRIGTALKARLLVQNTGSVPVVLQVPTFHQGGVTARNANDEEIEVSGIGWLTLAESVPVRLAPGESIEINTPGVGIGPRAGMGPWAGPRVGSNVLAKLGDELTLTHSPVPLDGSDVGRSEDDPHVVGPGWWLAHIKARLGRELPLPADAGERARLLDRAVRELFAVAPTAEETAAFTADQTPGAFDTLVKRLTTRADAVEFSGSLPTAPAKFRVLAADPVADKIPRVVLGPGEYPLSKGTADRGAATLKIVGRSVGDRRTNDAQLLFEATGKLPPDSHKLEVPDGWGTWAIVCRPNSGVFYLLSRGAVRKIDYSKPREVTDTPANDLPAEFRNEVKRQLEIAGVSAESQAEVFEKPAPPAKTADVDAVNAVRTAAAPGRYELGDGVQLQVRQVTENGKPTNSAQILFLSPDPKVQPKVPHLEKLPVISSTNRAPTQKAVPGETYDIGFYSPDAAYAFVWQLGANTLWVTEIREGPHIPIWKAPGGTRPGPQTVTVRSFDFSNHADVKLTHVTSSENGGDWSWGKIVPAAFHQPVLDALGERGKRLRDFIEPQKEKPKGAAVKLTPDALLGFWRGKMDGEDLMISFHRPPVEKDVLLDIYFGRATIGRLARFNIAPDGDSALVILEGAGNAALGTLRPMDANTMRLEGTDKEGKAVAIAMLTRDVEPPATEPRQMETRELFEMWKRTANEDGTIPGTFIGQLATEVRAYVKANPNSDSGMQLPKLLPRFVTSGDWTQAEAIKLLDDLAYYSTQPIVARVAKAKLSSGPLWRTEVEFQDIPVQIAKWSEAKDGLRVGMRVVEGDWRIGGKVRAELWLHNAGGKDVTFKTTGPDRQDVGVAVTAIDAEGREHRTMNTTVLISALPMDCTLPAGHVAMAKRFDVTFHEAEKEWFAPGFHDLKPGKYQLRCKWMDANATISKPDEWKGELTVPDHAFTLAAAVTAADLEAKPATKLPSAAAVAAPQAAETPKATEQEAFTAWGTEVGGLQAGLGFKPGEQRAFTHGETVTLVVRVRNVGQKEFHFHYDSENFLAKCPSVTDATGKPVPQHGIDTGGLIPLTKKLRLDRVNLAPDQECDLGEASLKLRPDTEEVANASPADLFGTGKVRIQYERLFLNTANGGPRNDPDLSTLATGKLELVVQEVPAKNDGIPAADEQSLRHEKRLQGSWQVVEAHVGGTHAPRESSKEQVWKFDRDKLIFDFGDGDPMEMSYRIDEKREPATIDLSPLGPREKGSLYKGIYQLDGDKLKVHFTRNSAADSRPTKFEPGGEDRGMRYFVLKRTPIPVVSPEEKQGTDAAAPFRDKLAELDAKIAALKMERVKLSGRLAAKHPNIRKLDAEVEALEEARAGFVATNPQALSPKPPAASKPLLPPLVGNPASVPQPLPEFVFARRDWSRSAKVAVADGVTVAIHEEVINRADIMATARIRYTTADGTVTGHDLFMASDVAGSRAKWAYGWERGTKTFWYCSVSPDNSYSLHRVSFADPQRITDDYQQYYPGEEPRRTLGVPDAFYAQLVDVLGFQKWTVVDKSNGLPEISGQHVVSAQPMTPAGVPVKAATILPRSKDKRWQVQFVDAATGQPVLRLRATVSSRTADGSRTIHVTRVSSNGTFEPMVGGDEYAWVSVEDENLTNAEAGERLFGNVPAGISAVEKHTNPDAPFIVKVKPRAKQAAVGAVIPSNQSQETSPL